MKNKLAILFAALVLLAAALYVSSEFGEGDGGYAQVRQDRQALRNGQGSDGQPGTTQSDAQQPEQHQSGMQQTGMQQTEIQQSEPQQSALQQTEKQKIGAGGIGEAAADRDAGNGSAAIGSGPAGGGLRFYPEGPGRQCRLALGSARESRLPELLDDLVQMVQKKKCPP
ncbi:hypothetical protein OMP40_22620 [Cohnella rhizosphaerae]|uniref:Uncharacterized protein n=1 Tax=Cohnella rhizosphaerae TaxID=1457232 RepID=A0A9X4L1K4_9BACL|nr:hypothetical protein [Cohnella rhizosphaerae]MDG0811852.1 hypothetical protein [Cohnella rhizosphaerae]